MFDIAVVQFCDWFCCLGEELALKIAYLICPNRQKIGRQAKQVDKGHQKDERELPSCRFGITGSEFPRAVADPLILREDSVARWAAGHASIEALKLLQFV